MRTYIYALAASALLMSASANARVIGIVDAGFEDGHTVMTITNETTWTLTDIGISAVGGVGVNQHEAVEELAPHQTASVPFDDDGGAFASNYVEANGADATTSYQVVVYADGALYFSNIFSPQVNLTKETVDFLGGSDVVNQQEVGVIATPEPSTWGMMTLGFAGLGFAAFHARRRASISIV